MFTAEQKKWSDDKRLAIFLFRIMLKSGQ